MRIDLAKLAAWFRKPAAPAEKTPSPAELAIADLERRGEQAYSDMYDAIGAAASGHYSDAKDYFIDAIGMAKRAGLDDEAKRLDARLGHIKAVFRSQF